MFERYTEKARRVIFFGRYEASQFGSPYIETEEGTLDVLRARKGGLEKFHGVTYTEEALQFAAQASGSYLKASRLPGKAVELLDAAGSLVKLRQPAPPLEIMDADNRIKTVADRLGNAIANHEFEKARFYSEEERKERDTSVRSERSSISRMHQVPWSALMT